MPDFGSPVAQNVDTTGSGFRKLSDILGLQQQQLNLKKSQATFGADVSQRQAESSSAQTAADVASQTAPSRVAMQQAQTGFEQFKLTGAHAQQAMQLASGLVGDPDFIKGNTPGMMEKLNGAQKTMEGYGVDPKAADAISTTLKYQALHNPTAVRQALINMTQQQQGAAGQQSAALPSPQMVNTGPTAQPTAMGNEALTGVQPGTPQGAAVPLGLPPTTPVMRNGAPGYAGAPGVQSGPALGQAQGVEGQVAPMVEHYKGVVQAATDAPQRIGILQEIKSLAPNAITGDAPALKKIVSKLAAYTGWTGSEQTPTDVMAKEAALLASKGGNTDMARLLNEAATPNGHMTKDAIQRTADQLIGIEKRNAAAQPFFAGTPPDSPAYTQKKAQWDASADPRAFEYAAKSPQDRAAMRTKMQADGTWDDLRQKMQRLHGMGVNP